MVNHEKDNQKNEDKQLIKHKNIQSEFNKDVINEDSYYKVLAYAGHLEKKRRDNRKETLKDPMIYAGFEGFDQVYMQQLIEEAKQKPREINPDDFKYKKIRPETFRDNIGKQEKYFSDH